MNSLSTIQQGLSPQDLVYLGKADPDLFMIKMMLNETSVPAFYIPSIIRVIGNLMLGQGYGKIMIIMDKKQITQIKSEESTIFSMTEINHLIDKRNYR